MSKLRPLLLLLFLTSPFLAQQQTKEQAARALYNQALLSTDIDESDGLLQRIIKDFPETEAATEAIKLQLARRAARQAQAVAIIREAEERKRARVEALGGFEVSDIESHGVTIPIPNNSNVTRSGTNPEIIKLVPPSVDPLRIARFLITTLEESKWKSMGGSARCWTKLNEQRKKTERLCFDVESAAETSIYMTTLEEAPK